MLTENRWKNSSTQEKVKYRSIVPTFFNLLADVTEDELIEMISKRETTKAPSGEVEYQETEKFPKMNETMPNSNDCTTIFSKDSYSSANSNRVSEDICMREDEDGVLSHFCPLDKDRDGVRDDNEDYPNNPMVTNFADWIKRGCSLSSDEIPYLMAEVPTKSDESTPDNSVSNVDSCTSMIYPPGQNRQDIKEEDKDLQRLLRGRKQIPLIRKLDEKILEEWSKESSDENDFYASKQNDEDMLLKYVVGDESDMEEFEANESEVENEEFKSEKDAVDHKYSSFKKESLGNEYEDGAEKSSASEHSKGNSDDVNVEDNEQRSSGKETGSKPNVCDEENRNLQSPDDQTQIELLKTEVENAILKATASLNPSTLKNRIRSLNCESKISEEEIGVEGCKNVTFLKNANETENCKVNCKYCEEKSQEKYGKEEKREHNMSNQDASNVAAKIKTESKECLSHIESEMDVIATQSKEETQGNFSMEPVAMNLSKTEEEQPDLKTALRFMTENYHSRDEDEIFFDTLSDMDLPLEKELPKADVKEAVEKPADVLLVDYKSPNKSSNFETVLTEDKRPIPRPRNKFIRLLSSFRKKLGKKA